MDELTHFRHRQLFIVSLNRVHSNWMYLFNKNDSRYFFRDARYIFLFDLITLIVVNLISKSISILLSLVDIKVKKFPSFPKTIIYVWRKPYEALSKKIRQICNWTHSSLNLAYFQSLFNISCCSVTLNLAFNNSIWVSAIIKYHFLKCHLNLTCETL